MSSYQKSPSNIKSIQVFEKEKYKSLKKDESIQESLQEGIIDAAAGRAAGFVFNKVIGPRGIGAAIQGGINYVAPMLTVGAMKTAAKGVAVGMGVAAYNIAKGFVIDQAIQFVVKSILGDNETIVNPVEAAKYDHENRVKVSDDDIQKAIREYMKKLKPEEVKELIAQKEAVVRGSRKEIEEKINKRKVKAKDLVISGVRNYAWDSTKINMKRESTSSAVSEFAASFDRAQEARLREAKKPPGKSSPPPPNPGDDEKKKQLEAQQARINARKAREEEYAKQAREKAARDAQEAEAKAAAERERKHKEERDKEIERITAERHKKQVEEDRKAAAEAAKKAQDKDNKDEEQHKDLTHLTPKEKSDAYDIIHKSKPEDPHNTLLHSLLNGYHKTVPDPVVPPPFLGLHPKSSSSLPPTPPTIPPHKPVLSGGDGPKKSDAWAQYNKDHGLDNGPKSNDYRPPEPKTDFGFGSDHFPNVADPKRVAAKIGGAVIVAGLVVYAAKKVREWWNSKNHPVETMTDAELRADIDKNLAKYYPTVEVIAQAEIDPKFRKRLVNNIFDQVREKENSLSKGQKLAKAGVLMPLDPSKPNYQLKDYQDPGKGAKFVQGVKEVGSKIGGKAVQVFTDHGKKIAGDLVGHGARVATGLAKGYLEHKIEKGVAKQISSRTGVKEEDAMTMVKSFKSAVSGSGGMSWGSGSSDAEAKKIKAMAAIQAKVESHINELLHEGRASDANKLKQIWDLSTTDEMKAKLGIGIDEKIHKSRTNDPKNPVKWID